MSRRYSLLWFFFVSLWRENLKPILLINYLSIMKQKANEKAVTICLADFVTWYTGEKFDTAAARDLWIDADLPEHVLNMPAGTLIEVHQTADDFHADFYCLRIIIDGAEYFADAVEGMPF